MITIFCKKEIQNANDITSKLRYGMMNKLIEYAKIKGLEGQYEYSENIRYKPMTDKLFFYMFRSYPDATP
jgi:hypothetical protein